MPIKASNTIALSLVLTTGLSACGFSTTDNGIYTPTYQGQELGRWGELSRQGYPVAAPTGQPVAPPGW